MLQQKTYPDELVYLALAHYHKPSRVCKINVENVIEAELYFIQTMIVCYHEVDFLECKIHYNGLVLDLALVGDFAKHLVETLSLHLYS